MTDLKWTQPLLTMEYTRTSRWVCEYIPTGGRYVFRTRKGWTDQHHHEELRSQEWLPSDDTYQSIQQVCIVPNLFSKNRTKRHWQSPSSLQTLTCSGKLEKRRNIKQRRLLKIWATQNNVRSLTAEFIFRAARFDWGVNCVMLRSYKMEIVCLGVSSTERNEIASHVQ
jgi:hypothetical protein